MLEQLIVADDLSGAAESAATFLLRTTRITVLVSGAADHNHVAPDDSPRVVVLDTDSRHLAAEAAGTEVARCVARAGTGAAGARVVKKVDSLLRGNILAEVSALAALLSATPVVATALPSAGRTVVDGQPLVHGRPLADTTLWDAEEADAPATVADVLAGLDPVTVPLSVVRDGPRLRAALADAARCGAAPLCDAETDADLDAVVAASTVLDTPLLVGSAALVAAVARRLDADDAPAQPDDAPAQPPVRSSSEPQHVVVAVVGSAAPTIAAQVALLTDLGLPVLRLDPGELLTAPAQARTRVEEALSGAGLVVAIDHTADVDPSAARRLSTALAAAARPATSRATVLLATGGETAHAVLTSIGVDRLRPVATSAEVVRSHTPDGPVVLTRPGSHGSTSSLLDALAPFLDGHPSTDLHR
ncbi:four-carbon acid sugar kinase family protein [Pedococcus bigeumensis]|uniref:four-carbon acid sugar kinase family protein n=1 Tax=Pedococcus bigeumensis TaxID=433644 RepID=UPI001386E5AC|nr:four-carbon acid sugar kinase family protein [Pedococcus bigeumensis]